jgi:hypothetical protein
VAERWWNIGDDEKPARAEYKGVPRTSARVVAANADHRGPKAEMPMSR